MFLYHTIRKKKTWTTKEFKCFYYFIAINILWSGEDLSPESTAHLGLIWNRLISGELAAYYWLDLLT